MINKIKPFILSIHDTQHLNIMDGNLPAHFNWLITKVNILYLTFKSSQFVFNTNDFRQNRAKIIRKL